MNASSKSCLTIYTAKTPHQHQQDGLCHKSAAKPTTRSRRPGTKEAIKPVEKQVTNAQQAMPATASTPHWHPHHGLP